MHSWWRGTHTTSKPGIGSDGLVPCTVIIGMGGLPLAQNVYLLDFCLHRPRVKLVLLTAYAQCQMHRLLWI